MRFGRRGGVELNVPLENNFVPRALFPGFGDGAPHLQIKGTRLAGKFLATSLLRPTTNFVPDLPRSRKREISLFSVRQSEIWVRDYPVTFCHQSTHTSVTAGIPLLKRKLLTNIKQGAYYTNRLLQLYSVLKITERSSKRQEIDQFFHIHIF